MDPKATKRMVLSEAMVPLADELDRWAAAREARQTQGDRVAGGKARALAGEIRLCLGQIELTDSLAEGEAATKRLQQLRSETLEFLARRKE